MIIIMFTKRYMDKGKKKKTINLNSDAKHTI